MLPLVVELQPRLRLLRRKIHIEKEPSHPAQTPIDFLRFEETGEALRAHKSNLYDRDLAPYIDNDLLHRRISSTPNRLLRHAPELIPQIRETLLADDDDSLFELAGDVDLARQLYDPEHKKPVNTILSYMSLLENINSVRAELDNETHIKPRLNVLVELLHQNIARSFPEELLDDAQLTIGFLVGRIEHTYGYDSSDDIALRVLRNLKLRLGGLFEAIRKRSISYKYVGGMPDDLGETISQKEAEADSRYISEVFAALRTNQRYGVKMGYVGDEKFGGALILYLARRFPPQTLAIAKSYKVHTIHYSIKPTP